MSLSPAAYVGKTSSQSLESFVQALVEGLYFTELKIFQPQGIPNQELE